MEYGTGELIATATTDPHLSQLGNASKATKANYGCMSSFPTSTVNFFNLGLNHQLKLVQYFLLLLYN